LKFSSPQIKVPVHELRSFRRRNNRNERTGCHNPELGAIHRPAARSARVLAPAGAVAAGSRFDTSHAQGKLYRERYWNDAYLDALAEIHRSCGGYRLDAVSVALRWLIHHSQLNAERNDGVIIGASSLEHLRHNLTAVTEGPQQAMLSDSVKPIFDAGLAELVELDHVISPEIRLTPSIGHTPGHVSVMESQTSHLAFPKDHLGTASTPSVTKQRSPKFFSNTTRSHGQVTSIWPPTLCINESAPAERRYSRQKNSRAA
jgi:hypothetical protein